MEWKGGKYDFQHPPDKIIGWGVTNKHLIEDYVIRYFSVLVFRGEFPGQAVLAVSVRDDDSQHRPCSLRPQPRLRHRLPEPEFHLLEGASVSNPGPPVQQYRGPGGGGHPEEAGQRGEGVQLGHGQHVHSGAQRSSLP